MRNIWKLMWKFRDCVSKLCHQFVWWNHHSYRQPPTPWFIMNFLHWKIWPTDALHLTHNVWTVYETQFRVNVCRWQFFAQRNLITPHTSHLVGFWMAVHILWPANPQHNESLTRKAGSLLNHGLLDVTTVLFHPLLLVPCHDRHYFPNYPRNIIKNKINESIIKLASKKSQKLCF